MSSSPAVSPPQNNITPPLNPLQPPLDFAAPLPPPPLTSSSSLPLTPPPSSSPLPPPPESPPSTQVRTAQYPPPPSMPLNFPPPPPPGLSYPPPLPVSTTMPPPYKTNPPTSPAAAPSNNTPIGLIIGVGGLVFVIVIIILLICYRKKKNYGPVASHESPRQKDNFYGELPPYLKQQIPSPMQMPWKSLFHHQMNCSGDSYSTNSRSGNLFPSPQAQRIPLGFVGGNFTYEDLAAATGGFSKGNLVGEGGFGYVHKGILGNGRVIAVKQLKMGSRQGEREFQAEIETISRVHHKHLVSLVGYCITGPQRLLVYEFVPNKTLELHLHGKGQPVMDWATRMKIAIGSAKGLAYLHEDCYPTIIHRDIKASNILLDCKFEAKVADFGLAKFFSDTNHHITHVSTRVVGTFGYLAPEYAQSGKASDKSDTFSYGVVLLELITGHKPISTTESSTGEDLVSLAIPLLTRALENGKCDALVDPRLEKNYNDKEMATMVACAAACVCSTAWRRPRMSQIVRALEGDVCVKDLCEGIRAGYSTIGASLEMDQIWNPNTLDAGFATQSGE